MRDRQIFINLALTLASVIFAFLLVEIMLRIVPLGMVESTSADRGYFSKFDPELGWVPIPNVRRYHSDHDFSVLVEQNSLGLRAPEEIRTARGNGDFRALVLGDSYVWGYGAGQADIFTNKGVHGRQDLELINMGVSGYGTDQALLLYRKSGNEFDVDAVVLVFTTYNDLANNLESNAYGYDKPYFTLDGELTLHDGHVRDSTLRRWWTGFLTHSRAATVVNNGILNLRWLISRSIDDEEALAEARDQVRTPQPLREKDIKGLNLTAALIAQLRDEVEANGAQFQVVFVPFKPHVLAQQALDHPLVTPLGERLAARGVKFTSPYDIFLERAKAGERLFNLEDNHFNAAGHKLFGEFVAGKLPAR